MEKARGTDEEPMCPERPRGTPTGRFGSAPPHPAVALMTASALRRSARADAWTTGERAAPRHGEPYRGAGRSTGTARGWAAPGEEVGSPRTVP
ncbi:hypothetical protein [Streptomyces sp. NPDC059256]|uniref:hypothetical protein n=1 Tax=Streptomyces sp. NPDC059256 TaxID=3346794 RepID=UPI003697B90F